MQHAVVVFDIRLSASNGTGTGTWQECVEIAKEDRIQKLLGQESFLHGYPLNMPHAASVFEMRPPLISHNPPGGKLGPCKRDKVEAQIVNVHS